MEIQNEPNQKKNQKCRVKVAIRVRPMVPKQIASNENACVSFQSNNHIVIGNERQYKFDKVFDQKSKQSQVYDNCVKDLILGCFDGYNAAILAYGQTGSGKTFTMGTAATDLQNYSQMGIIPRVIKEIFSEVQNRKKKAQFIVKVSFFEIYNQQILDLLSNDPQKSKKESAITIRQEKDGSVSIYGAVQEKVTDTQQMVSLLERGSLHRTTKETEMNSTSSRSHAIFTVFIQQHVIEDLYQSQNKPGAEKVDEGYMTAKFFFVDLAGSERAKKTGATGALLKEGININLGLLQLGNVISSLATIDKKQGQFITYRNSKLTRILQDSLGGNSNTYMIACASPAQSNYEESLNTLKYASKAMNIKNKPVINRDPQSALISQLKQKIFQLELENRKIRQAMSQSGVKVQHLDIGNSKDLISEDLRRLKMLYVNLEKKHEQAVHQLREQTKKANELSIQNFEARRERDLNKMRIQSFKTKHSDLFKTQEEQDSDSQKQSLLESYSMKIAKLESELKDKDQLIYKLENEYDKLHKISQKDQKILLQKSKSLYTFHKQNKALKKEIDKIRKQLQEGQKNVQQGGYGEGKQPLNENKENSVEKGIFDSEDEDNNSSKEQIEVDILSGIRDPDESFEKLNEDSWNELKSMDKCIQEKENHLSQMTNNQIQLEYQLIEEMKQQYHQKVMTLQREKQGLVMQKETISGGEKNKLGSKIDNLENELKQYRRKMKQQKNIEKVVSSQNSKIKDLATQIKKFRIQKIQLASKIKEEKDTFQKFKTQKVKDLMKAKKENMKKENQLKRASLQNKKNTRQLQKKNEQLKKAKKINQTLKAFVKPTKRVLFKNKEVQSEQSQSLSQKQYANIIKKCIKTMLYEIDRGTDIFRYETKIQDIQKQIQQLLNQQSKQKLKMDRIKLNQQGQDVQNSLASIQEQTQLQQLNVSILDIRERLANLQQSLDFYKGKYSKIINSTMNQFDIQTEIVFNPTYDSKECMRGLLISLFISMNNALIQDSKLRDTKQKNESQIKGLKEQLGQLKNKIFMMNQQHQENLSKIRDEMIMQSYNTFEQQEVQNQSQSAIKGQAIKMQDRQKKIYEKKIIDLTKNNRQLSADVQMWRRKCGVIQQKYQSMRNAFNKDKFIGRSRDDDVIVKDKKLNQSVGTKSMAMLEEVNQIFDTLNTNQTTRLRKNVSYDEGDCNQRKKQVFQSQQSDFNKNRWDCLGKIEAHSSPILSLATHANMLISTGTKSLKIWDLQTSKIISDLSGPHLSGFVKHVIVNPQRKIMATACDKVITLWDLMTLNVEGQLKAHKDEVRTMHMMGDYMFSGGKGTTNGGSLLTWDFRNLNPFNAQEQKQKNQDVFTMTSHNNTLYYGTRNHQVRRMNLQSMEILSPFEPPHMDTVTGLAVSKGYLISGSKDKNLRLWSPENNSNNIKYTIHAFNDYINTVQSMNLSQILGDPSLPVFYSGARDGQVKIGAVNKDKIQVVGGIMAHTQSVNTVCPLDNNVVATGSSDKAIKIWQPTSETVSYIQNQF